MPAVFFTSSTCCPSVIANECPRELVPKMGTYLSKPVTKKVSADQANERVAWGASSMQGWRITQEVTNLEIASAFYALSDLVNAQTGNHNQKVPNMCLVAWQGAGNISLAAPFTSFYSWCSP